MTVENWFLIALAFAWIAIAVVQDLRKREVANWLNFSLIAIALAYRAFVSVLKLDYEYFLWGIGGFAVFFVLAHIFYYGRIFAGGDAKLLIALGAVLPFFNTLYENVLTAISFIILFLTSGSIYGLLFSFVLAYKHKEKFALEIKKQFSRNKKIFKLIMLAASASVIVVLVVKEYLFFFVSGLLFLFPFLFIYAKVIEESCMVKLVSSEKLTEGDWLYEDVKIGSKKIKASWEGLSIEELEALKKSKRKILIREGIPFTPAFLIAFILLVLWYSNRGLF